MTSRLALALVLVAFTTTASAITAPPHLQGRPALELFANTVTHGVTLRATRQVRWDRAPVLTAAAWARFRARRGAAWRATFDRATGVPSRLFGPGLPAPGAVASAAAAETFARAVLTEHIDLLAPGARPSDFVLAANDLDAGIRSVGFFQTVSGVRVLHGQVSFRFKNDRLFVIGSEALPAAAARLPRLPVTPSIARARATAWVLADAAAEAVPGAVAGPFVLPLVADDAVLGYRTVLRVEVAAERPLGAWDVYVDAATGAPVAREQTITFENGAILFDVPVRHAAAERQPYPAAQAWVTVNGAEATTDHEGMVSWAGSGSASIDVGVEGPYVKVWNAAGAETTTTLSVAPSGSAIWDRSASEYGDAQLTAFIHTMVVKERVRRVAPTLAWLDTQQPATVNRSGCCNAYSTGDTINFYVEGCGCANYGRIADVVYHEFGHNLHHFAIIPGVGDFDGAQSEGIGDFLAATTTGDAGTARGTRFDDEPLRDLDTPYDHRWPDDIGEIHYTGIIYGGAMFDLRKNLVALMGEDAGVLLTEQLFYQSIRRTTDIPSSYVEVLAADDDDGDLTNGTPRFCAINEAFARHGLADPIADPFIGVARPVTDGRHVLLPESGSSSVCPTRAVGGARIEWRRRDDASQGGQVALAPGAGGLAGELPALPPGTAIEYQVVVEYADGGTVSFPDNPADPWYQHFAGEAVTIYCTDFEGAAPPAGWTHGLSAGSPGEGADDWQWGTPAGESGSGDPGRAFSGERVYGNDLGGEDWNGLYQADKENWLESPEIDAAGWPMVRLQYRRWLNVEDGTYDHATIFVGGEAVWDNAAGDADGGFHHTDREWRFHDLDVTAQRRDGKVKVRFQLASDGGVELGGWTIDDFCLVGFDPATCADCGEPDAGPAGGGGDGGGGGGGADPGPEDGDLRGSGCRVGAGARAPRAGLVLLVAAALVAGLRRRRSLTPLRAASHNVGCGGLRRTADRRGRARQVRDRPAARRRRHG